MEGMLIECGKWLSRLSWDAPHDIFILCRTLAKGRRDISLMIAASVSNADWRRALAVLTRITDAGDELAYVFHVAFITVQQIAVIGP